MNRQGYYYNIHSLSTASIKTRLLVAVPNLFLDIHCSEIGLYRVSYTNDYFIWNLLNEPSASLIYLI